MKVHPIIGAAIVLAAISGGCKRSPEPGTTQTTSAENPPAAVPTVSIEDRAFMTKAAHGSVLEVTLGRLATQRARSPDVKAFGQRMSTDHQKAGDELSQLAAKRAIVLPTVVDDDQQKLVIKLSKMEGAKFDAEYTKDMVEDHEKDVKDFRDATKNVKDPELRDWASKTLPVLEDHLSKAKEIQAKLQKASPTSR